MRGVCIYFTYLIFAFLFLLYKQSQDFVFTHTHNQILSNTFDSILVNNINHDICSFPIDFLIRQVLVKIFSNKRECMN